jgi:ubiquitin-like protein Pup
MFQERSPHVPETTSSEQGSFDLGSLVIRADAERAQRPRGDSAKTNPAIESSGAATADQTKKGEELKAELDDLLDEIDEVLEENAEEFVRGYVQKGGQ